MVLSAIEDSEKDSEPEEEPVSLEAKLIREGLQLSSKLENFSL